MREKLEVVQFSEDHAEETERLSRAFLSTMDWAFENGASLPFSLDHAKKAIAICRYKIARCHIGEPPLPTKDEMRIAKDRDARIAVIRRSMQLTAADYRIVIGPCLDP